MFLRQNGSSGNRRRRDYLPKHGGFRSALLGGFNKLCKIEYNPLVFSGMIFADRQNFDRKTYKFKICSPRIPRGCTLFRLRCDSQKGDGQWAFHGRIWVEDRDYNIVRLNGTYAPHTRNACFFHMDSWRLNLMPGYWVPACIYSEEGDSSDRSKFEIAFKARSRLWGYELQGGGKGEAFTKILVDSADSSVKDHSLISEDASPLQAQRQWMQQAADNVIERLAECRLAGSRG